jgi:cytochrome c
MAGAVYHHEAYPDTPTKLPAYYDGKVFLFEWMRRWVQAATVDADGHLVKLEHIGVPGGYTAPIDVDFAPDGTLYILEYGSAWFSDNPDARLVRLAYDDGDNPPPTARVTADRTAGATPLVVALDATSSSDPNHPDDALHYAWFQRTAETRTAIGAGPTLDFTATDPGRTVIEVEVTDPEGASATASVFLRAGNEPPMVHLDFGGANGSVYTDDTSATRAYTVRVEDAEDGTISGGEIHPADVRVTFEYLAQGYDFAASASGHVTTGSPGTELIKATGCTACHQPDAVSVGPSFAAIAERYAADAEAPPRLAAKIIAGGSGNWGAVAMSAHPSLTPDEALLMASAVLGRERSGGGLPHTGTLHFDKHGGDARDVPIIGSFFDGQYVIEATYLDRGAPGAEPLSATVRAVFRHKALGAAAFPEVQGIQRFVPPPLPGFETLLFTATQAEQSYARLPLVDLTGVSAIRLHHVAINPFFAGGEVGLRLDAPDADEVVSATIPQGALGIPSEAETLDLDVSSIEGVHDLYLTGARSAGNTADGDLFLVIIVEMVLAP